MVINIVSVLLIFNTDFFFTLDRQILSTQFDLIAIGVSIGAFFITLKFIDRLSVTHLFIIFIVTRIAVMSYFTLFEFSVEMDFRTFSSMAQHVLDGDLFTPFAPKILANWWRVGPPMYMWWYTYNYLIYGLNPIIWRFVNILLEVGIVYVMIQIFQEIKSPKKQLSEENFKIGLSFYIFSMITVFTFILNAFISALPVLLGLLGFLYYFKSKKESGNIYVSIFFFSLCALCLYFAAIWILGLLLILLFRRQFKLVITLSFEVIGVFILVTLPLLLNDAIGYLQRLIQSPLTYYNTNWNGSIFASNLFDIIPSTWLSNLDPLWADLILGIGLYIPTIFAIILLVFYIYKNSNKEISLDFFIVSLSIFLFFTPHFAPWYFPWIFPLICINIIYSFRKFFIANLFFIGYFFVFMFLFALAYLLYPGTSSFPNWSKAWDDIRPFMESNGFLLLIKFIGHLLYQMGFIYLIYSYTNEKRWVYVLILGYIPFYAFSLLGFI